MVEMSQDNYDQSAARWLKCHKITMTRVLRVVDMSQDNYDQSAESG